MALEFCAQGLPANIDLTSSPGLDFNIYSAVYLAERCRIALSDNDDSFLALEMKDIVFEGNNVSLAFLGWIDQITKLTKRLKYDHTFARELNSIPNNNGSPLFTACTFGLLSIVRHLEALLGCDWNQLNDDGQSGLYLAAAFGNTDVVQILPNHDMDVDISGGKFHYPLHAARFGGHIIVVQLLLDHGADPKLGVQGALELASLADHEDIALLLLKEKLDVPN